MQSNQVGAGQGRAGQGRAGQGSAGQGGWILSQAAVIALKKRHQGREVGSGSPSCSKVLACGGSACVATGMFPAPNPLACQCSGGPIDHSPCPLPSAAPNDQTGHTPLGTITPINVTRTPPP